MSLNCLGSILQPIAGILWKKRGGMLTSLGEMLIIKSDFLLPVNEDSRFTASAHP